MEKSFEKSHPFVVATYFVCSTVLVMLLNHPIFLLLAIVLVIANAKLFVATSTVWKTLKGSLLLIALVMLINMLFNKNGTTEIFVLLGQSITLEALVYSVEMGGMLLAIFQLSLLFNATLNGAKFLYIVSKLAPKLGLVTMLALRYVPLLKMHLQQITSVQRLKGHSLTEGSFIERIKSGILLLQQLLSISLEDALQTADSMKARGYQLRVKRTSFTHYEWNRHDTLALLFLATVFIAACVGTATGLGIITIYPTLNVSWATEQLIVSAVAGGLLAFPLILQSLEWCKWKYYAWKM